ncbi:MAG: hypothetical protein PHQ14_08655 [Chromatiales bacterium]|nr:hypothetical protein [Chromatiales bacterium]
MKRKAHAVAGVLVFLCIAGFWSSTVVAELFLGVDAIVTVKRTILNAMWLFIPLIASTGASGFALARRRAHPLLGSKQRRMPFIAANGLLILLPAAIFLAARAEAGVFDLWFYAVQSAELAAGAVNLLLVGLNIRDGLRLRSQRCGTRTVSAGG